MKKLTLALALLLVFVLPITCLADTTDSTPPEPGAVFDSVADFHTEDGQTGVWQYYFSGDNGETFDPCGSYDDYGTVRGWHPWEGSYTGVGFNNDVPGFLELNTDCHSEDFSGQMGVLAFEAPADGKYVLTAAVWNPWEQNCEKFTFKHSDGTVIYEQDMTELVECYGYITPTDVELKAGDRIYIYCNAAGGEWVSAYVNATIYFEPTDDSCYEIPEITEIPTLGGSSGGGSSAPNVPLEPSEVEGASYNAYQDFDNTGSQGENGPWVYGTTTDGKEFTPADYYEDKDYGAHQWFSENGTGVGPADYTGKGWLELNFNDGNGEMSYVGFKAPEEDEYTFYGSVYNPYGQGAQHLYAVMNGEKIGTYEVTGEINAFVLKVKMAVENVVYFFSDSSGGWVSNSLNLFVGTGDEVPPATEPEETEPQETEPQETEPQETEPEETQPPVDIEIPSPEEADYNAYDDFDPTSADGENTPWVYGSTTDGKEFTTADYYEDTDWDAHEWYTENGTGVGKADYVDEGYLELNVNDGNGEMTSVGFRAETEGKHTFFGSVFNPYDQDAQYLYAVMDGEEVGKFAVTGEPTEFALEVQMNVDKVIHFYCDSVGGWVSNSLSLMVQCPEGTEAVALTAETEPVTAEEVPEETTEVTVEETVPEETEAAETEPEEIVPAETEATVNP